MPWIIVEYTFLLFDLIYYLIIFFCLCGVRIALGRSLFGCVWHAFIYQGSNHTRSFLSGCLQMLRAPKLRATYSLPQWCVASQSHPVHVHTAKYYCYTQPGPEKIQIPAAGKNTLQPSVHQKAFKASSSATNPTYIMHEKLTNYLLVAGVLEQSGSEPSHIVGRPASLQL